MSVGGNLLNDAIVQRVEVRQRLNDHWICEIECRSAMGYAIPGDEALGAECSLANTAEDGSEHLIFAGIVIDVAIKVEVWGSYSAVLRAASSSWLMDHSRRNAYFGSASINEVASTVFPGVACMLTDRTSPPEYVQMGETNWEFLLRMADDHGGWIRAGLGSLELSNTFDGPPQPLIFRDVHGLLEFWSEGLLGPARIAAAQYDSATSTSQTWPGEQRSPQLEGGGAHMGGAVAEGSNAQGLLGFSSRSRSWSCDAMGERARVEAERAQGSGVLAGGTSRQQTLTAGGSIAVQNCKDADGTYHLLEVTHVWTRTGYLNHFTATAWKTWHGRQRPRPAVAPGVQAGRVTGHDDPLNRGRLAVSLFWQEGPSLLWAPMTSLHSGANFGLAVRPEIGDEVLVSFLDGDPERPVILGSLWNGVQQPPREQFATPNESSGNLVKRIMTKSGIRIHIVDTPGQESISLATPRSNHLLLSEKVAETGRPVVSLSTLGDIHVRAAGRTHEHAGRHSRHVDGKIMKGATVSIADIYGNTKPFETVQLDAQLSGGGSYQGAVGSGQGFQKLDPGTSSFTTPEFYVPRPPDSDDDVDAQDQGGGDD